MHPLSRHDALPICAIGTHHPDGIFMAAGPGIPAAGEVGLRRIVYVAPTLLYSAGVSVPADFEGEVPATFFTPAWMEAKPVKKGARTHAIKRDEDAQEMDSGDKQQIIEQLQMLGYME